MKENNQVTENLETPTWWKIFLAYLLDILFIFTIFWGPLNAANAFWKQKNTFWNGIMWIKYVNMDGSDLTKKQARIRYLLMLPISVPFSLFIFLIIFIFGFIFFFFSSVALGFLRFIESLFILYNVGVLLLNIVEICYSEGPIFPTFIDKRLWIKRVYNISNKTWTEINK